jgi:PAS domain S-box-containing protein
LADPPQTPLAGGYHLLIALTSLALVFALLAGATLETSRLTPLYLAAATLMVTAGLLDGRRHYRKIALTAVIITFLIPVAALLAGDFADYPELIIPYTALSVIIAFLFFESVAFTASFAALNLIAAAAAANIISNPTEPETVMPVTTVALIALLMVVAALIRRRYREQIARQSQALGASQARYSAMIEAAFEAILVHDNGLIIDINRAGEEMFGYDKAIVTDQHLSDLLTETLAMPTVQAWREEEAIPFESVGLRQDGSVFPVEVLTRVYRYQERLVHVSAVRDITFRKQYENHLRYQMRIDQLIAEISRRLTNLAPDALQSGIETALDALGDFTHADRAYVALFADDGAHEINRSYEWHAPDISEAPERIVMGAEWPWLMTSIHRRTHVAIASTADLPHGAATDREQLLNVGVHSVLIVPMIYRDRVIGAVGLNMERQRHAWDNAQISVMTIAAELIVNALERTRTEEALRLSEQRFSLIFRASPVPIAITRQADGTFIDANESYLEMIGYDRDEIIGNTSADMDVWLSPDEQKVAMSALSNNGDAKNREGRMRTRSGAVIDTLYSLETIELDGQQCVLALVLDITDRKRAQDQTRALELEREQVRILQRFIDDASHDFKTPLSIIRTDLYLISRTSEQPNHIQSHLDTIDEQVTRMQHLLDDLLTMSHLDRATSEDFHFGPNDLNQIVQDVINLKEPLITTRGHDVAFESDPELSAIPLDAVTVGQAVEQLLTNACTYTPDGGRIRLRTYREDHHAVIEINDNGVGIEETDLPHIFERFYRVDKSRGASTEAGTGLGLPIVRRIVEAHNGRIAAESTPGQGSTFRVWLPINETATISVASD